MVLYFHGDIPSDSRRQLARSRRHLPLLLYIAYVIACLGMNSVAYVFACLGMNSVVRVL
jgi:hypothetical protein